MMMTLEVLALPGALLAVLEVLPTTTISRQEQVNAERDEW
jgi:hypothetical protein